MSCSVECGVANSCLLAARAERRALSGQFKVQARKFKPSGMCERHAQLSRADGGLAKSGRLDMRACFHVYVRGGVLLAARVEQSSHDVSWAASKSSSKY